MTSHAQILKPLISRYREMGMDRPTAHGLARIDLGLEDCPCCGLKKPATAPGAPKGGED